MEASGELLKKMEKMSIIPLLVRLINLYKNFEI